MYQENCQQLNDDGRISHLSRLKNNGGIPVPPPLPNGQTVQNHPSLLINNTYTIKRELRNNHLLANNETNSLNFISGHHNGQNIKVKKKMNLDKSSQQLKKNNLIGGQFENNLASLNSFNHLNNLNANNLNNNNPTPTNVYPTETDCDDNQDANNSLPDFQNYAMQPIEMQPNHSNNFFSLPYQQVNYPQYNEQETCVKYPQQSLTVDRSHFGQSNRNCVNNHCTSHHHPKKSSSPFLNTVHSTQEFNNRTEHLNQFNTSIEDLRNEASSKQHQCDDRSLQPTLISALRHSISTEKQRLYKEQLRNELAMKLKMKNHIQPQTGHLSNYLFRKKPKYEFFSQLYFLFHISFTFCLFKVSGKCIVFEDCMTN